jgi:hypothetical protein
MAFSRTQRLPSDEMQHTRGEQYIRSGHMGKFGRELQLSRGLHQ